jgi:hypothetical protein
MDNVYSARFLDFLVGGIVADKPTSDCRLVQPPGLSHMHEFCMQSSRQISKAIFGRLLATAFWTAPMSALRRSPTLSVTSH